MAGLQEGGIYGAPTQYSQQYQANLDANSAAEAKRKASAIGILGPAVQGLFNTAYSSFPGGGGGGGVSTQSTPTSGGGFYGGSATPSINYPPAASSGGGGAYYANGGSSASNIPFGGTSGSGGYPAPPTSQPNATLAPPDTTASTAAQFAKAKDAVGQESKGALTALKGAMAGRGIVGSGVEGRGIASTIAAGQQQLGDTSRQLAVTNADLAQKNAEAAYQGGITQRGQDIGQNVAAFQGGVTERGQDIGASTTQRGQDVGFAESQNQLATQQQIAANQLAAQRQQALLGLLGTQLTSLGNLGY